MEGGPVEGELDGGVEGCEGGVGGEAECAADGRVGDEVRAEGYFEDVVWWGCGWGREDV